MNQFLKKKFAITLLSIPAIVVLYAFLPKETATEAVKAIVTITGIFLGSQGAVDTASAIRGKYENANT